VTGHGQRATGSSASALEELLQALVACDEVHLIVKNVGATAELRGAARLSIGESWLTIEVVGTPHHLHVRRGALSRAEFLTGGTKNCGVRFLMDEDQAVLACYLPGTAEDRPGYSSSRRAAFDRLVARHCGAPSARPSEGGS
jgi:hypothetical protein